MERQGFRSAATVAKVPMTKAPPRKLQRNEAGVILGHAKPTVEGNDCGTIVSLKVWRVSQQHDAPIFEHFAGCINVEVSGMASGQFPKAQVTFDGIGPCAIAPCS